MATKHVELSAADGADRADRRSMFHIWVAMGILLIGCVGLGVYSWLVPNRDETFNFIALLIIFMTALAASSIIFVSLKMGSNEEAFGLPSGSVRALLAIGIMILFVVFGLPVVSSHSEELSSRQATVPAEQVAEVMRLNKEQGFLVRVLSSTGAAGTPGARTQLEIVQMNSVTAAQMDLNKQMLTAIITLLTTVIGFYFGSRSATDGMAAAPSVVTETKDTSTTVTTDPVTPPDVNGNGNGGNGGNGNGNGGEPDPG
jgi:hypothetical protein